MDKNIYITQTFIENKGFSELDFELQNEFGFEYDEDYTNEFEIIEKGKGYADGYPVNIDKMIELLKVLKSKGATHVELDYHCDQIGYDISGYKIEPSSQSDIDEYNTKIQKHLEKNKKINELYDEIKKIEKS